MLESSHLGKIEALASVGTERRQSVQIVSPSSQIIGPSVQERGYLCKWESMCRNKAFRCTLDRRAARKKIGGGTTVGVGAAFSARGGAN